ncbi:SDR family oxidoreductase [Calidifontimicrobium sp. SYSU G02091]|uniref:SDR family oxidoreductase n=1 Tax=Calidifontimicrobium sp. SYSU G02091 TaxID=2926421 RepID=UPI001F52C7B0|nr:SDR family oxidoreductase [Calidifontimicrobium sp. SYSU G02091]MCI1191638.1 SDR family oxidoreductase [Calidifontimicrobium sp. SYSU G02091]
MKTAPLVFITGASSGIGQALALRYAQAGWRLALVARRGAQLEAWAREQGLDAARCAVYAADVQQLDAIGRAARECIARQGLPDVVIANAGISVGMDTAEREDLDVMRDTLEVNLLGVAATFQPFLAPMRERRAGTLVGIASVAAIRGLPGHGAYCASKAGVVAYCESLRVECRPYGVRVVTLLPGFVATPLTARNRYAMPFLLSAAQFAERAYRAIGAGESYRVIPWQMAIVAKLLRALPNAWFDRLMRGRARKRRRHE